MKFIFKANKAYESTPSYPKGFEDGQIVELPESFDQFPWWIRIEEKLIVVEEEQVSFIPESELKVPVEEVSESLPITFINENITPVNENEKIEVTVTNGDADISAIVPQKQKVRPKRSRHR